MKTIPHKPVLIFDMDDTLAESKQVFDPTMITLLSKLLVARVKIGVISGGKFEQFKKQMIDQYSEETKQYFSNLLILPTSGGAFYSWNSQSETWSPVYAHFLSDDEKQSIREAFNSVQTRSDDFQLPTTGEVFGEQLEDRETQMTFSALGQKAPIANKKQWDPNQEKRKKIVDALKPQIPGGLSIRIGGTTSIDISKPGIDKAYGIEELVKHTDINKEDIHFIGDKMEPGGNDYPVIKTGVTTTAVDSWEETYTLLADYYTKYVENTA